MAIFGSAPVVIPKAKQAINIAQGAISMFSVASSNLKRSNALAQEAIDENNAEMERLKLESAQMAENVSTNNIIIGNIEKFLGITKVGDEKKDSPV